MARVSVEVLLESSDGTPVEGATVSYTVGGALAEPCELQAGTWLCGWEVEGALLIEATSRCHGAGSETVHVPMGECHVQTQELRRLLDPVDCTTEEVPSVLVTVHDEQGEPIPDVAVGYLPVHVDWMDYGPCEPLDDAWACGWGWSGAIDLEVQAPGYTTWTDQVVVEEDCCGPITEQVDVELLLGG
jgi:hypothetical protein